jgi:hypothetical protein
VIAHRGISADKIAFRPKALGQRLLSVILANSIAAINQTHHPAE